MPYNFIPHDEPFFDDNERWVALADNYALSPLEREEELDAVRAICRHLSLYNEFAVNALENRINYLVGCGHQYTIRPKKHSDPAPGVIEQVETWLDEFLEMNHWHRRQQEIVRRMDRDGEVFIRLFPTADGLTRLRFVDPERVRTPDQLLNVPNERMGISFDKFDAETINGYWIDGQYVAYAQVQHRKANVDSIVPRGLPLFFPVRKNLYRAEKLLRNMSIVAEIQSAIAIIRKHQSASQSAVDKFVNDKRDAAAPGFGPTLNRYGPGTILDASATIDYQFPVSAIDAGRYVTVLQAELRAIAARLVMPEFMLTSDASNANYASTMVAEGPAVRMFQRLQHELSCEDVTLIQRAIRVACSAGRLPHDVLSQIEIHPVAPSLAVRDRLRETQADKILFDAGVLSKQEFALRNNLSGEGDGSSN